MKKNYINPEVQVAQVALESMVLAGSPASPAANPSMGFQNIQSEQW